MRIATGWVNEFLSWEGFQPLSRLTYIIYLVHMTVNTILHSYATFVMVSSNFLQVSTTLRSLQFSVVISLDLYFCCTF